MIVKNLMSAFIGLWFFFTPWLFEFNTGSTEAYICFILGSIQVLISILAVVISGKKALINWVPLLIGVWFIIFPNAFNLHLSEIVLLELLGLTTLLLNYALIFPESQ
ncbi:MAG: hypothetical protein K0S39_5250 [Paenibacillus sp.]|jgi:hypothetical protein|nr:hypothetical protein [Paenibacillus sp.]